MAVHMVADDELIAYAAGAAPESRRAEIARHVRDCAACASTVATYHHAREAVRWDAVESPSPATVARLKHLMAPAQGAAAEESSLAGALRQVVARLVFDGRQPAAAVGLRGAADTFALVYSTDDVDVDLQLEPPGVGRSQWMVTGQIGSPEESGNVSAALVSRDTSQRRWMEVDETGMFTLTTDPGTFDVLIRLADREVVLPNLRVG